MSKQVRSDTKNALRRALQSQPGEKGSKWTASDEAAAMGGVIDFLQNYMKRDGTIKVMAGKKHKGAAAQLAFTALEFANKCGGVGLSFGGNVAAEDDEGKVQKEDAAPAAPTGTAGQRVPDGTQMRAHGAALNILVGGKKLYGRLKYLEVYKPRHITEQYNIIDQQVADAESTESEYLAMIKESLRG